MLCNITDLHQPDFSKPFHIYCDASNKAAIAFAGKTFNDHEVKYATPQKELYSIYLSIKKWKHYIHGSDITIYTDHKAWAYRNTKGDPTGRIQRWLMAHLELGHPNNANLLSAIRHRYNWSGISSDIANFRHNCSTCIKFSSNPKNKKSAHKVDTKYPLDAVGIDTIFWNFNNKVAISFQITPPKPPSIDLPNTSNLVHLNLSFPMRALNLLAKNLKLFATHLISKFTTLVPRTIKETVSLKELFKPSINFYLNLNSRTTPHSIDQLASRLMRPTSIMNQLTQPSVNLRRILTWKLHKQSYQ